MSRYVTWGPVRGRGGIVHRKLETAARALRSDIIGCREQGGYSDRRVWRLNADGDRVVLSQAERDIVDAELNRERS